ncbi:MAG: VCBS repeat-containing protein [bacterium]|nr:VCBS repeat-containing protein [bacterium]
MKMKIAAGLFLLVVIHMPAVERRDFGFGAMEIFEFSNLTSELRVADINRDGRDDILFLNNKLSRLEILVRKESTTNGAELPALEERFTKEGFVLDNWVRDFQAADMNGDLRPDIVTMDNQKGIRIIFRETNDSFREPVSLQIKKPAKLKGFEIADLNSDGYTDILVYRQENAEIFYNNRRGKFKTQTIIDFASYGCSGAMISDINSDNIADILFYFPKETLQLRIRTGNKNGRFGWEEALQLPNTRVIEKLNFTQSLGFQLGMILRNGLIFRLYEFQTREGKTLFAEDRGEVIPRRLPLKGVSRKNPPAWVTGDIDRDGLGDFCAAAPLLNQVHLYKGTTEGLSPSPVVIDSLRSIKTMDLTRRGDLVVFSEAEKAVAVHPNNDLTAFPRFLKTPGEPTAMATAGDSIVFVLNKSGKKDAPAAFILNLFDTRNPGNPPFESHDPGISNAPTAMKVFPLESDNHWGIILFMPYDKPLMYRLQKDTVTKVAPEQFGALGSSLNPRSVTAAGSKKQPMLLVTEGSVARLYRWNQDRFVVEGQLNPRVETARLISGCLSCSEGEGYLLYDDAGQDIYRFPGTSTGSTRIHIKDGINDLTGLATLRSKESRGILLVGQSEIQWLQENTPIRHLKNLGEHVSGMEKPALWNLYPVSLGSPGRPMVALMDANNRSVELVGMKDSKLVEELVFEVFQDPGFNNQMADNVYEPHDLATGDFNGDNIRDIVILVHDKLIIYLGE